MAKVESARVDPIKIPLCAYVEEVEEVAEPQIAAVNQTENKAFLDPQLGSVVTLVEIHVPDRVSIVPGLTDFLSPGTFGLFKSRDFLGL